MLNRTSAAALAAAALGFAAFAAPIVPDATVRTWFESFSADDDEIYTNAISNAEAVQWAMDNIPRFECPDRDIERTYYFRWWTYRKHLKRTHDGWVVTEFLPNVRWAGPENTISCPLNHHVMEGRWLRDGRYLDDYISFMARKGFVSGRRCYACAPAAAALERARVTGGFDSLRALLPEFVRVCEEWDKGWTIGNSLFIGYRPERGLYDTIDAHEGTECSLSGSGARPMVNAMRWADMKAVGEIARLAGDDAAANRWTAKADALEREIKAKLWNREKKFFTTIGVKDEKAGAVCELHGYAPFYFGMPLPGYGEAWKLLMDSRRGFSAAPKGLTFPARDSRGFRAVPVRSGCRWDGPSWPYATSVALTALYKILQSGADIPATPADFTFLLGQYAAQHRLVRDDGKVVSWIDEDLDAYTGEWLERGILLEQSHKSGKPPIPRERGKDYNHSTFCDLVIAGLCGIRPTDDGRLDVKPLAPEAWDWWCVDGVRFHGRDVTVLFDRYGTRYGKGKGLVVCDPGQAEENIPERSDGSMPEDKVMERMEHAVAPAAWKAWREAHPAPFWLFGEERRFALRNNIIPAHWFEAKEPQPFRGVAQPGEFYPFQVCVVSDKARKLRWSAQTELKVERVTLEACEVAANGVKPIWVMVDIPKDAAGKTFKGAVRVEDAADATSATLPFEIEVLGDVLEDGGVSDAWRLARLKWLNSNIGREDTVTKPYTPVAVDAASRTVKILGREILLGADGLPAQIVLHFSGSNTRIEEKGMKLLAAPFAFKERGTAEAGASRFAFVETTPTHAAWRSETELESGVRRIVEGRMDYTGSGSFRIRHAGGRIRGASLEIKMPGDVARYMEGLGRNGADFKPGRIEQKWDAKHNRDAVWVGRVNGGLAVRFKGANYCRPLENAYYAWGPLAMPESWAAGGGSIVVEKNADGADVRAWGKEAPEGAEWNFDLFVTPFHTLDMKTHFSDRYCHMKQRSRDFDAAAVAKAGASIVNLHHNTLWNPYINYPYNDDGGPFLKKVVKDAHDAGLLLKVYYTTRELTQNMPEFFALKSLNGEVLMRRDSSVPGWPITNRQGPHPWLREHVGDDIIPAWRENVRFPEYPERLDLAVVTTPWTRWDNFYLEGLDYLVREYGIDGLYIDDTALSGESMQRARRILDRDGKRRLIDNHSWNHHSPLAGSGSSNLAFIDLYPYFDLLWRGEGFSNDTPPDFWLVERSGVAFGIAGEMLGRGNPFRGLLFGMTDRWGWGGNPLGLWKFFDAVGLGDMEFTGWWDDECPVKVADSSDVKASVWKGDGCAVVVLANFSKEPRTVSLAFGKSTLGFDAAKVAWSVPCIDGVQDAAADSDTCRPMELPAGGGMVLYASTALFWGAHPQK